ncbi:MAG: uroporphyrinogen-III C-methyltransferase [Minwuia sp.]|nr:uroporphyrinogen-III C-methyltransferase [Minwuia sp.]
MDRTSDITLPPGSDWPVFQAGWVWLAGAGPGDPGLLTLHALSALQQADVIVYDALVDSRILGWARPGTLIEFAGKRGGKPSPKQRDITLRLIALAQAGKRVLRLKGGDPFVFGRGGEEALALVDAGVPFRIIPGVTAGVGGLAYAGIPVTHRDVNQSVTFLTGHDQNGLTPSKVDWTAIARGSPVIVMYMAVKHLGQIADSLIAGGRTGGEPVAIVTDATLPTQRVVETTLADAADIVTREGLRPPALVVVGGVVGLRASLNWVDGRFADPVSLAARLDRRDQLSG